MATYTIGVSRAGVEATTITVQHGDDVSFVIDRDNPPPSSSSLQVISLTRHVEANSLFDESSIPLSGNLTPRVRSRPKTGSTYEFEIAGDWTATDGPDVPTTGKIHVGSGGGEG